MSLLCVVRISKVWPLIYPKLLYFSFDVLFLKYNFRDFYVLVPVWISNGDFILIFFNFAILPPLLKMKTSFTLVLTLLVGCPLENENKLEKNLEQ